MRSDLTCKINKAIICLLFLVSLDPALLKGQEEIGGVVNKYAKVTYINVASGYVQVSPAESAQFSAGDYVLLIQMQGVGIQTAQGSYGINVQSQIGTPGAYEFLIILAINYGTGRIDFTRNVFVNSYNVAGNVQLVQVPFYNSPTVTSTLRCQEWNSTTGTGGVLAFFAGETLTLNADIDLTGLGFKGALGSSGIGECVFANEAANNHDSYPLSWNNAGLKGEGVAIHDFNGVLLFPNHARGQGRNFSGGGGGNGRFSGGAGGSNRGKGGDGGLEKYVPGECGDDPRDGGFGGMTIAGTSIQNGLFAGGGGGASTALAGSTASDGGNGGGIIIIVTDSINGNGHIIKSDGTSAANAVSNAGAGGGGAGGSIALSFQGIANQAHISATGGNGGTNPGGFGQGGGGGGGLLWFSTPVIPAAVASATVTGGTLPPTNPTDGAGEVRFSFIPKLNGFLFNYIRSAVTGTRTDSTCSNVLAGSITGTMPVGGNPPYTYAWQQSTTSPSAGFTTAQGVNNQQHYTVPALLTQTTWFRRVVTDNGASITDISLPVMVTVHPFIKNNIVGNADTLCYGQNSPALHSTMALLDGNGTYAFKWESSSDNVTFSDISANTQNYTPPDAFVQTTWFRRTVMSGSCIDISPAIRLTVLDSVSNNSILTSQEICHGMTFSNLTGTVAPVLEGGDNIYRYRWESSPDNISWSPAAGIRNTPGYNPDENAGYFPGQQYFRRVVLSGNNDVCVNISRAIALNAYPPVTGNLITSDQVICSGSSPVMLNGSIPQNGKEGSYTYTWQDSTKTRSWTDIAGYIGVTNPDYLPPALTDTTGYRRIVLSSACTSYSLPVIINVHKPVSNNTISLLSGSGSDTTLCNGATPARLSGSSPSGGTGVPGSYTYQWSQSADNVTWNDILLGGTSVGYQPGPLAATTYFRRRASSGTCSSESDPVTINVLPLIANNTVSGSQTVCKSNTPALLTQASGSVLSGGSGSYHFLWEQSSDGGTTWNPADGTNDAANGSYQPGEITRTLKYRRHISSGFNDCCSSISNIIEVVLDSLPAGATINAGADTILYSFDRIFHLTADQAIQGGTGKWTIVEGSGSFADDTDNHTSVSGISPGLNRYLWTITRGACTLGDMVDVMVYDLVVPEGFSPNNDPEGLNNTFVIKGLDLPNQEAELTVINGAGTEIFHTSNLNGNEWTEWDGRNSSGSDLPEGTYYYLLRIVSKGHDQVFKKSGFIILKRF